MFQDHTRAYNMSHVLCVCAGDGLADSVWCLSDKPWPVDNSVVSTDLREPSVAFCLARLARSDWPRTWTAREAHEVTAKEAFLRGRRITAEEVPPDAVVTTIWEFAPRNVIVCKCGERTVEFATRQHVVFDCDFEDVDCQIVSGPWRLTSGTRVAFVLLTLGTQPGDPSLYKPEWRAAIDFVNSTQFGPVKTEVCDIDTVYTIQFEYDVDG